jgi:hypothetical protein
VEVCGVYDVVCGCVGIGYARSVRGGHTGWEANEGNGMEDFGIYVNASGCCTMCEYGYCGVYTFEIGWYIANLIQAYVFDTDDRFFVGWKLDKSWILCTVSWSIAVLSAAFISLSAFVFPSEGGYELIPSERYGR